MKNPECKVTKFNSNSPFSKAWLNAFSPPNLVSGFQKCGFTHLMQQLFQFLTIVFRAAPTCNEASMTVADPVESAMVDENCAVDNRPSLAACFRAFSAIALAICTSYLYLNTSVKSSLYKKERVSNSWYRSGADTYGDHTSSAMVDAQGGNGVIQCQKAIRGQPAPWHLTIVIMIAQKANDPMWTSQHTVLYYKVTVYNVATMTNWTFIY